MTTKIGYTKELLEDVTYQLGHMNRAHEAQQQLASSIERTVSTLQTGLSEIGKIEWTDALKAALHGISAAAVGNDGKAVILDRNEQRKIVESLFPDAFQSKAGHHDELTVPIENVSWTLNSLPDVLEVMSDKIKSGSLSSVLNRDPTSVKRLKTLRDALGRRQQFEYNSKICMAPFWYAIAQACEQVLSVDKANKFRGPDGVGHGDMSEQILELIIERLDRASDAIIKDNYLSLRDDQSARRLPGASLELLGESRKALGDVLTGVRTQESVFEFLAGLERELSAPARGSHKIGGLKPIVGEKKVGEAIANANPAELMTIAMLGNALRVYLGG